MGGKGATGELDQVLVWLDKAIEPHPTELFWIYDGENPIRKDPHFAEVKRKMGILN